MVIIALISPAVLAIAAITQTIRLFHERNEHAIALDAMKYSTYKKSFGDGWNAALNNYSAMRKAMKALENDPE
jgi:hypothetical protein